MFFFSFFLFFCLDAQLFEQRNAFPFMKYEWKILVLSFDNIFFLCWSFILQKSTEIEFCLSNGEKKRNETLEKECRNIPVKLINRFRKTFVWILQERKKINQFGLWNVQIVWATHSIQYKYSYWNESSENCIKLLSSTRFNWTCCK